MSKNWTIEGRAQQIDFECTEADDHDFPADRCHKCMRLRAATLTFGREVAEEAARIADQSDTAPPRVTPGTAIRQRFGLKDKP